MKFSDYFLLLHELQLIRVWSYNATTLVKNQQQVVSKNMSGIF